MRHPSPKEKATRKRRIELKIEGGYDVAVLFSGGLDSAMTAAYWAECEDKNVLLIHIDHGFLYKNILDRANYASHLLREQYPIGCWCVEMSDLWRWKDRQAYQAGRNLIYASVAASIASQENIPIISFGFNDDYSSTDAGVPYRDATEEFSREVEKVIRLATDCRISIENPFSDESKADLFRFAERCGILDVALATTSCMAHVLGIEEPFKRHEWGHGCGVCEGCQIRQQGWKEFKEDSNEKS